MDVKSDSRSLPEIARELFAPHLPCDEPKLRRVYLRLALQHHPDKVPETQRVHATRLFQAISAVYEEMSSPGGGKMAKRVKSFAAAAAELADLDELRRLLVELPTRANEVDDVGVSPLMFAAKGGSVDAAEILLSFGADLHVETPLGWSAVVFAGMSNEGAMVEFLWQQGASISSHDLILVVYTGQDVSLEVMLKHFSGSVATLTTSSSGWTLLHLLCEGMCHLGHKRPHRFSRCVDLLLDYGVPIDAIETRKTQTCLQSYVGNSLWIEEQLEISSAHLRFVEQLCEGGASVTQMDSDGNSALTLAASAGLIKVQTILQGFSGKPLQPAPRL